MKFVSVLVLVCAFACASAQFGVKGGASDSASGVRSGAFFPRFSPAQGTKGRLRSSAALYGPSELVTDDADLTGRMGDQRDLYFPLTRNIQPSNRFLYDNRRPAQYVQYDATPLSAYSGYSRNYYSQPQVANVMRVPTFASTGYGSSSLGSNTLNRQYASPTVVSRPAPLSSIAPLASYAQGSSGYRSAPVAGSIPSVSSDYVVPSVSSLPVSTLPRTSPTTVTPISGNVFTDNKISSPGFSIQEQDRPEYRFTSVPAARPVSSIPSPQSTYSISSVPVSGGYAVPSVSSVALPSLSIQTPTSGNIPVGQIFSDNKISSPGSSTIQSQLPVISQEKQFIDTVQTTEW